MTLELRGKDLFTSTGSHIGICYKDVDGYYVYETSPAGGSFDTFSLRLIADKLDELNKEWNEHLNDYFKKQLPNTNH